MNRIKQLFVYGADRDTASQDAAFEITMSLQAQGLASWLVSQPDADLAQRTAEQEAERQIEECHPSIRSALRIEIEEAQACELCGTVGELTPDGACSNCGYV